MLSNPQKHRIKKLLAFLWYKGQGLRRKLEVQFANRDYRVPILNYHSVAPYHDNPLGFRITPDSFEQQIGYLTSHYNVISLPMLVNQLYWDKAPKGITVVTFDDGYRDNYIYAYPILRKYKCPATIFLPTAFIEREIKLVEEDEELKPLRWSEIMEMKESGMISFGSHGHSHRILTKISPKEVNLEIELSKKILEDKLGEEINLLAYPNGQRGDFNKEIIEFLKKNKFISACSTIWSISNPPKKLFFLNRVRVDPEDDLEMFKLKLVGAYDYIWFIHSAKSYLKPTFCTSK